MQFFVTVCKLFESKFPNGIHFTTIWWVPTMLYRAFCIDLQRILSSFFIQFERGDRVPQTWIGTESKARGPSYTFSYMKVFICCCIKPAVLRSAIPGGRQSPAVNTSFIITHKSTATDSVSKYPVIYSQQWLYLNLA